MSFSEINQDKKVVIINTDKNKITKIEEVTVPRFREILRVEGELEVCIAHLNTIKSNRYELKPWAEVVLDNKSNTNIGYFEIHKATDSLDLEVLKVTLKNQRDTIGLEQLIHNSKQIKTLSPTDVFKLKCQEQDFDIDENPDIMDAFNEVLNIVRQN